MQDSLGIRLGDFVLNRARGCLEDATGADLDITLKESGVVVANHDNIGTSAFTKVYKQATHAIDGSASLYAAGGEPTEDYVFVAGEPIRLVIANGGNAKSGTFYIWTG
jgi:hypothetical protein